MPHVRTPIGLARVNWRIDNYVGITYEEGDAKGTHARLDLSIDKDIDMMDCPERMSGLHDLSDSQLQERLTRIRAEIKDVTRDAQVAKSRKKKKVASES